jgi:hypothetical protein
LHEAKLAFVAQSWPADLNAEILEVMHQATVAAFEREFFFSLTNYMEQLRASPTEPCDPAVVTQLQTNLSAATVQPRSRRKIRRRLPSSSNYRILKKAAPHQGLETLLMP